MIDLRTVETLPAYKLAEAEAWRNKAFAWKRWGPSADPAEHSHCRFCHACICDKRDHDPDDKPGPISGGHYRHAYYAEDGDGANIWVCRSCFKRLSPIVGWTIQHPK